MNLENKKVLILEENVSNQNTICKMLVKMEIEQFAIANNVFVAWLLLQEAQLQGQSFDFVIAGWEVPEVARNYLIQFLRCKKQFNNIPFLVFSNSEGNGALLSLSELDSANKKNAFVFLPAKNGRKQMFL